MADRKPERNSRSPPTLDKIRPLGRKLNHVDELLTEYPEIAKHIGDFKVSGSDFPHSRPRNFKDSIVVFKKKKLPLGDLHNNANIYEFYQGNLELDLHNQEKSRTSCQRCRRYKKKCTRDLPECLNCASCEEMCYYVQRKKKSKAVRSSPLLGTKNFSALEFEEPDSFLLEKKTRIFKSESPQTLVHYVLDSALHQSDAESISSSVGSLNSEFPSSLSPKSPKPESPKSSSIHWLLN